MTTETKPKMNKGFAVMDKSVQQQIASRGGKAAHASGKAHKWDSAEAAAAGKKGAKTRWDNLQLKKANNQ